MKKILLPIAVLVMAVAVAFAFLLKPGNQQERTAYDPKNKKKKDRSAPGWEDQYFEMKKNPDGIIPYDILDGIRAAQVLDRKERIQNNRPLGNLQNVQEAGPNNRAGRTRAFMVDRTDENHLIAGGVSGGIWRSTNKGQSWQAVNDFESTLAVTDISQNPFDPNIIYYSTGEASGNSAGVSGNGVFKSTDKGLTFTQLPSTATNEGFRKTFRIKCSLTDPNTVFVGSAHDGLYRSTDAGATFEKVFTSTSYLSVTDVEVFPDGSVMIGVYDQGIYKSPTGAAGTFVQLTNGLPSDYRRVELAYCDSFPNIVYALLPSLSVFNALTAYKTLDAGNTWTQLTAPTPTVAAYASNYCLTMAVKPDNPNFVVLGGVTLGFSVDGGTTWTPAGSGRGADQHLVVFNPFNVNEYYNGNDHGIFWFSALAPQDPPVGKNLGYNTTQYYAGTFFPSGNGIIAGAQDNGTSYSATGGPGFAVILGGDGAYCHVHPQNPDVVYMSAQNGAIRRIDDMNDVNSLGNPYYVSIRNELDADNNLSIDDGAYFINPFEINKTDGDQVYFSTQKRIWRSLNKGDFWEPIMPATASIGKTPFALGITKAANPRVYGGGSGGFFCRIDNAAGANPVFTNLSSNVPQNLTTSFIGNITVHPQYDSVIYVSFTSNALASSIAPRLMRVHAANTASPVWVSVSDGLPQKLPVNWVEVHPTDDQILVAATDMGIYTTIDGGATWLQELEIPNVPVFMLRLRESDKKLYIYTHGRGAWTAQMPEQPLSVAAATQPVTYTIYPNPTSGSFSIEGSYDKVELYSVSGQKVYSFIWSGSKQPDISSLLPGTYVLRLFKNNLPAYSVRIVKR